MDAALWRKATQMAAQQATATADSTQLQTLPLSQLSIDESGLPQVIYPTHNPLAASTPRTLPVSPTNMQDERQIIPGIPNRLYPALTADSQAHKPSAGDHNSMANTINDELDKYLQQAAQKQNSESNYFKDITKQSHV